jgi:hypothetical protein
MCSSREYSTSTLLLAVSAGLEFEQNDQSSQNSNSGIILILFKQVFGNLIHVEYWCIFIYLIERSLCSQVVVQLHRLVHGAVIFVSLQT